MADQGTDIIMKVVRKGVPIATEGRTDFVRWTDILSDEFEPGFCCSLFEFSLSIGGDRSNDEDGKKAGAAGPAAKGPNGQRALPTPPVQARGGASVSAQTTGRSGSALMQGRASLNAGLGNKGDKAQKGKPVAPQEVTFERFFDAASIPLINALVGGETLDSLSVIKRKATGSEQSGEAFLRLDFTKVLLFDLNWQDEDEAVRETGKFHYREIKIRYRRQNASGILGPVVMSGWTIND